VLTACIVGWDPSLTVESVLLSIRTNMISGGARLDHRTAIDCKFFLILFLLFLFLLLLILLFMIIIVIAITIILVFVVVIIIAIYY
jgi:hypothetical protein